MLFRSTEKYHAAQKTQALGTLAGGIAHDFNNIIGSILGNCSLLMIDTPKEDPGYERLRQIIESGTRARDLVRQILTYSRNAESERKPLELGSVVKDSLTIVNPLMPSNVSLPVEQMDECLVSGDATQIHQVLLNLCLNAVHAMQNVTGPRRIRLATRNVPGGVEVSIADTGPGLADAVKERLFQPFNTSKERGMGVGLSICRTIIEAHGGTIVATDTEGGGATFAFTLDRKSTRLNSSHIPLSRMPSSA